MNEWGVFGVIVAVVGFCATIIAPILRLNTSITKLTVLLDEALKKIAKNEEKSHESHLKLWEKNSEQDRHIQEHSEKLYDHEGRIKRLEEGDY